MNCSPNVMKSMPRLLHVVDAATEPWGVKVTRIEIKDINPPQDLVDAMGRQMKAERDQTCQPFLKQKGKGNHQKSLGPMAKNRLPYSMQMAEKNLHSRDAQARERLAQAEARATAMVSKAIADGDVQAINYFVATKYVDALKDIAAAPNQKVILMPLEASNVIGAVAGISEIAKEAFGKGKESS